jgi:anthranilate/para-aminobenzoate synthase component I
VIVNASQFLNADTPLPLLAKIPVGGLTPIDGYRAMARDLPSFLLESGAQAGRGAQARFSFVGGAPYRILEVRDGLLRQWTPQDEWSDWTVTNDALRDAFALLGGPPLELPPGAPPFIGGVVGCLGYGLSRRHLRPSHRTRPALFPDVYWLFVDLVAAFDHADRTLTLSFCPAPERFAGTSRESLLQEGQERLEGLLAALTRPVQASPAGNIESGGAIASGMSRDAYCRMAERAKAYIAEGDIFQANLAQRFTAPYGGRDGFDVYCRLRAINPSPFAAFLDLGDTHVICSSPERLARRAGRDVETRPIAGTRPRGTTSADDARLTADLLLSAKERAEHLMLVDLERNDLGRVCAYGSVKVDELMVTEQYSHVIHIVSNIRGTLRDDASNFDIVNAVFPGGTVTGVPKIRCLEIIEELEPVSRGLYTGSIGYVSWSGHMDWNIVIRTLTLSRGELAFYAGAGIVADSDPEREYSETLYKAQALINAIS